MRCTLLVLAALVFALAIATSAPCEIRYVRSNSPGPTYDGKTWSTAFQKIQDALKICVSGDEVWVAAGSYSEAVSIGTRVSLYGGFLGNELSRADRNWKDNICVVTGGATCLTSSCIDGFRMQGAGVTVSANGNAAIRNNTICAATYGVSCVSWPAVITNNRFLSNSRGIYANQATCVIRGNEFYANSDSGIYSDRSVCIITNNTIVNSTFGVYGTGGTTGVTATNNIVAYNITGMALGATTANVSLVCNDVYGNATDYTSTTPRGATDISIDPKLACWQSADLHIQPDSPCLNAGNNSAPSLQDTDIDNQPRIQGTAVDIGSDESDGTTWPSAPSHVVYVNASAPAGGDGKSWATAYSTITAALASVTGLSPTEVWVARGNYAPASPSKSTYLYGGFAGSETSREQRDPRHNLTVFHGTGEGTINCSFDCTIDGFVVQGMGDGITCYQGSPRITNNVIVGCTGSGINCSGSPTISGNIIAANVTGIYGQSSTGFIVSNTIVGNTNYGIRLYQGSDQISNNIIAFSYNGVYQGANGTAKLSNNDLYGNWGGNYFNQAAGTNDILADPKLVGWESGDMHLSADSPCRNTGLNTAVGVPALDIDGRARVVDGTIDIGADEFDGDSPGVPTGVVYVNAAAAAGGDGTSWQKAFTTIQAGLDATAALGANQVWVAEGQYSESIYLVPFVQVLGGFAGNETGLSQRDIAEHNTRIVTGLVNGANAGVIDGLTILGRGVSCESTSPTVRNCRISNATYNALHCSGNIHPQIINNILSGCSVAILSDEGCRPTIVGNAIMGNWRGIEIATSGAGVATITNNTIAYNSECGVFGGTGTCANNIVAYNDTGIKCSGGTMTLSHNDVYGNSTAYNGLSAGSSDFSADPLLSSYQTGDVHIFPTSPCRNAGDGTVAQVTDLDIDGQPRVQEGLIDVGADETDGVAAPAPPRVIFVKATAPAGGNGKTWATAYNTIASALSDVMAGGGAQIWVAKGTYTATITLAQFGCLYGGFSGSETQLDQRDVRANTTTVDGSNGAKAVIGCTGALIDGFTVTRAQYGIYCDSTSPTISNNSVTDCTYSGIYCKGTSCSLITGNTLLRTGMDGAIYPCYSATVKIVGNYIADGTNGVRGYNSGLTTINNNVIRDNLNGGIYCSGLISATNNTIVGNATGISGTGTITNNLIAYNATGVQTNLTGSVFSHNDVYGNVTNYNVSPGATDISVDPKFADTRYGNFHIQPDSPCRNAGADPGTLLSSIDMDGQARVQDGQIDIGADESDGTSYTAASRLLYVNCNAVASGDGSSWGSAFKTIGAATTASKALGGADIWVAGGSYAESVSLPNYTCAYSGFAGSETALSQRNWRLNPAIITSAAVKSPSALDGFVVRGTGLALSGPLSTARNNTVLNASTGISCGGYGSQLIQNNVIAYFSSAGIYSNNCTPRVVNNTIIYGGNVGIFASMGRVAAVNNIVAFNKTGISGSSSYYTLSHNDVYGNVDSTGKPANYSGVTAGAGDISADPGLFAADALNVHIAPTSPCRNAGIGTVTPLPDTDFEGQSRVMEGTVDIGADETDGSAAAPSVIYVNAAASGGDGSSWASACSALQAALALPRVALGGEMWVAGGSYSGGIALQPYFSLYGGFTGTETKRDDRSWCSNPTIINGQSTVQDVVTTSATNASLDGFTISGGRRGVYATGGYNVIADNLITGSASNGIDCAGTALIANNLISKCTTNGIYTSGVSTIANNTIVSNIGNGIYCMSAPKSIANNIICFNNRGIYNASAATLSHNDVFGNTTSLMGSVGPTDISINPNFVSSSSRDYHLLPGSACIDAGAAVDGAPANDLDGVARPKDGNGDGTAVIDMGCYEAPGSYTTIAQAKTLNDGAPVGLACVVSTGAFADRLYVESASRNQGIGVVSSAGRPGRLAVVEGLMGTVDGERVIKQASVRLGASAPVPAPWALCSNALGGGPYGKQSGVWDYRFVSQLAGDPMRQLTQYGGPNNIGLLVKLAGRIGYKGSGFFYLNDGCPLDDGDPSVRGVRVDWPFLEVMPPDGANVVITGISSCTLAGSNVVRLLRPLSASDVRVLQ